MSNKNKGIAVSFGRSFVEAIFEFGKEKDISKISTELLSFSAWSQNELGLFLQNPVFEPEEKEKVLQQIFKENQNHVLVKDFIQTVVDLDCFGLMPQIYQTFEQTLYERKNEVEAKVETAMELSKSQEEQVRLALEAKSGKKVVMNVEINPELIGGIRARVGSVLFDASVGGFLQRLQEENTI